jgi:hypothetical protein
LFKLLSVSFFFETFVAAVEAADDCRWDGFSVTVFFTVDSNNLSSSGVGVIAVVNHGACSSSLELLVNGVVDASVEVTLSRGQSVLSVGLSKLVLTLDTGNVASVAWNTMFGGFVIR